MATKTKKSPPSIRVVFDGIEVLRSKHNLNRREMAEVIGVSPTTYTFLTRRPSLVRLDTLTGIIDGFAKKFGETVTFDDILKVVPQKDHRRKE